ncbi:MAG: toll/interleukin-1 receptor domain-containing protein [Thermoplasmata archaeon]|nr:MAG: toll/interleukin-1 receptor domain-containing protein [Thermoplasmata archaeon]
MEANVVDIKSLRIFFSYSSSDRKIVGGIKDYLERMGFEVFLAHEDISPGEEWQQQIIKNLKRCDIFIPLLTNDFKNSEWTDQEIGIALTDDKFIIPLQVDIVPYGFIGKIQSLKINKDDLKNTADDIFRLIKNQSPFKESMKDFIINALAISRNFEQAKVRSKLLMEFENFSSEQIHRIFEAAMRNNQVYGSFGAQDVLKKLFEKYKNYLKEEEYKEVMEKLKRGDN